MEKKRVCAYCRVSTNTEDQDNSYENQKNYFEREISKNPEYYFSGIYADKGITGTSLTKRKDFNRMLTDAGLDINDGYRIVAESKFDMIYVKNTSRFARNVSVDVILKALALNKVYVYFLDLNKTTENSEDITYIQIFLTFDERDSRDKSKKVRFGMREGAEKGNIFVGCNFYGYRYIPHPENRLEIIEEEAKVVRKIYELYLDGYGSERICRILSEDLNMLTRQGKIFKSTTILGMLKNEKYAGLNYGMKIHTGELFGDRRKKNVPAEEQIRFETDKIPAIIDKESFYKAQEIRESSTSGQTNKGRYLGKTDFAGIVTCGKCGCTYQACGVKHLKKREIRYYACRHKYRYDAVNGIPRCENPTVTQDALDEALSSTGYSFRRWNRVKQGLNELKQIRSILESRIDLDNEKEINQTKVLIDELIRKKGKLLDLYLDDTYTKEELNNRVQPLESELHELNERVRELSKTNDDINRDIANVDEVIKVYSEECDILQDEFNRGVIARKVSRKELLNDIASIVVEPDGDITLNFKSLSIINEIARKHRFLLEKVS